MSYESAVEQNLEKRRKWRGWLELPWIAQLVVNRLGNKTRVGVESRVRIILMRGTEEAR